MKKTTLFVLMLAVAGLTLAWFIPAQAHAMLMRSIPDANASLPSSPPRVDLYFSEAVAKGLSKISVMDSSGKQVDNGNSSVDPADGTHLLVTLPALPDGIYLVAWKAISATDGHQTSGSFPFSVGKVAPNAMATVSPQLPAASASLPVADMVVKGFLYLASSALLGGVLFTFLAWNPSYRKANIPTADVEAYVRFTRKLALTALLVLAVADILSLMLQAGQVNGSQIGWPWQPDFIAILTTTRVGMLAIVRFGLAILLAGLLLPVQNRWNRWIGFALCLLLLLTFSLESHAAGNPSPLLPVLADWFHLTAVSVWVGGLFSFLGGMLLLRRLAPEPATRLTSFLIPHFTTLAMTSVGILAITGIYSSTLDIGTLSALWSTTYGQAFITKLLIAAPMLGLGAINFLFTTPVMRRAAQAPGGSQKLVTRFRYLLTTESFLGVVILLWVGAFTTLPPASMIAVSSGISKTAQANDLSITLTIDPGRPGLNTFTATITSAGKPVTNAQNVSLEFTSLSGMLPPSKADMIDLGNGKFSLQGGYLGMPDNWDIKVVVIRPGKFDAYGDFIFNMSQPAGQSMP